MAANHFIFLVEDRSTEVFLQELLPRLLPQQHTFEVHSFGSKSALRMKLLQRLRAYPRWLPHRYAHWRIVVVVDRDTDDCHVLKGELEDLAARARLRTRSQAGESGWQVVNRIAIEELEAWYFGDWDAVCAAYPRVSATVPQRAGYRDPDAIRGGTWEAFEKILKRHGYFKTGLRKTEAAREVASRICWERTRSRSFRVFVNAVLEAIG